jgi:hypothetical protein
LAGSADEPVIRKAARCIAERVHGFARESGVSRRHVFDRIVDTKIEVCIIVIEWRRTHIASPVAARSKATEKIHGRVILPADGQCAEAARSYADIRLPAKFTPTLPECSVARIEAVLHLENRRVSVA